jgi:hypothetical protein
MVVAVVLLALATGCTAAVPIAEGHVSLDGRRLELLLDACNADTQLQVDDSADMVAVQVRRHDVVTSRIASGACQDIAYVDLERPLGDRPVVDRSDDRRLPVSRPQPGTGTQPPWPYDRERVTPAEYRAALRDLVRCLERRDPQITARIVRGLNLLTYDWTTADEEGTVEADAIEVCEREHLDPLA